MEKRKQDLFVLVGILVLLGMVFGVVDMNFTVSVDNSRLTEYVVVACSMYYTYFVGGASE